MSRELTFNLYSYDFRASRLFGAAGRLWGGCVVRRVVGDLRGDGARAEVVERASSWGSGVSVHGRFLCLDSSYICLKILTRHL